MWDSKPLFCLTLLVFQHSYSNEQNIIEELIIVVSSALFLSAQRTVRSHDRLHCIAVCASSLCEQNPSLTVATRPTQINQRTFSHFKSLNASGFINRYGSINVTQSVVCPGPLCVCLTVWGTYTTGATAGEEADWTSDEPNPQVRWNLPLLNVSRTVASACCDRASINNNLFVFLTPLSSLTVPLPCLCCMNVSTLWLQVSATIVCAMQRSDSAQCVCWCKRQHCREMWLCCFIQTGT